MNLLPLGIPLAFYNKVNYYLILEQLCQSCVTVDYWKAICDQVAALQ